MATPAPDARKRWSAEYIEQHIPGAFPDSAGGPVSHQTLSQAVHARRAEYTKPSKIRIKVGSWNVAAFKGTDKDVGGWFVDGKGVAQALAGLSIANDGEGGDPPERESVEAQEARRSKRMSTIPKHDSAALPGGEEIGIFALGLQEVVDVSSPTEALRPFTDPEPSRKFKYAMASALPNGYTLVAEQQLLGMLLLIYASPKVAAEITSVSTTSVGTGLMGYMGNKGAVTARIVLGETTRLVFVNCHLAAGADSTALERRNWDAAQIASRTKFDPITDPLALSQSVAESFGEEDFAFWFGDLNYRLTGMPGGDIRRLLMLHARNQYDVSQPSDATIEKTLLETTNSPRTSTDSRPLSVGSSTTSTKDAPIDADDASFTTDDSGAKFAVDPDMDPASLQATLSSLLPHDELLQQQRLRKAFHEGWREGPIKFLPTYKYDAGKVSVFDSSEKKRCPSWCDRILYRSRRDRLAYEARIKEEEQARKKDEEMKARGMEHAGDDEDVLFNYDPQTDGEDYDEYAEIEEAPGVVTTKAGFEDEMELEYYTSHQRVLSSDHKPLDAVFILKYDAVIPELKARVHQEVARDLDRAENEGRPRVTILVDKHHGGHGPHIEQISDEDPPNFEGVDFRDVRYLQKKTRNVSIANTGAVPATFGFVDRPVAPGQDEGPAPHWVSIEYDREADVSKPGDGFHSKFTLDPGDVCNVELKLKISDIELVRQLNEGVKSLEDILVVRVEGGRDHFLPLRARWLASSLSRSIDKLIRIPEGGVRRLQGQRPTANVDDDSPVKWSAPRELFRLTEAIEELVERTLAEYYMTSQENDESPPWKSHAGWPFEEDSWTLCDDEIRDDLKAEAISAVDDDATVDSAFDHDTTSLHRLEILAETLLLFLNSMRDGVVTLELWNQLEEGMLAREKAKQTLPLEDERMLVLEVLSSVPSHNVSFVLLTSMLSRISNEIAVSVKTSTDKKENLPTSPVTPKKSVLSQVPAIARRQVVDRTFASVFSKAMIRTTELAKGSRDSKTRAERMMKVVEMFISEAKASQ